MGASQADKAKTHERLVAAAAARFREKGLDGISLADLMKELGLTHGGFYKHFASRDALVAEAVDRALDESEQRLRALAFPDGAPDRAAFVERYLSEAHRDALAEGCAVTGLASDVARKGGPLAERYREQIERNLAVVAQLLPEVPEAERRAAALDFMVRLYGALTLARGAGDSRLSREILRNTREQLSAATPRS